MHQSMLNQNLKPGLRVAIVGSRNYQALEDVKAFVKQLPKGVTVVSGGANGVDIEAEKAAKEFGHNLHVIRPELATRYVSKNVFRNAAYARNERIVEISSFVVAFWDGQSGGTRNTLEHAKRLNKQRFVIPPGSATMAKQALEAIEQEWRLRRA